MSIVSAHSCFGAIQAPHKRTSGHSMHCPCIEYSGIVPMPQTLKVYVYDTALHLDPSKAQLDDENL